MTRLGAIAIFLFGSMVGAQAPSWARLAAYDDIVWPADTTRPPRVLVGSSWFELVSIDSVPVARLISAARTAYGQGWRERFDEDMVEVLAAAGRARRDSVMLGLRDTVTGQTSMRLAAMNAANRARLMMATGTRRGSGPGVGSRVTMAVARAQEPPADRRPRQNRLPAALTNREFWALIAQVSEPDGVFRSNSGSSDNLLSNEMDLSTLAGRLAGQVGPGGVYLGVGPEQNFTYIATSSPRISFITDIRRGNLQVHLFYKAAFELSANRAEFVGRAFSRQRPAGLTNASTAAELMAAYTAAPPLDDAGFNAGLRAIQEHLTRTRALPLSAEDLAGIEYVARQYHKYGPLIFYNSTNTGRAGTGSGTYAALMATRDVVSGVERSYLATELNFAAVKAAQANNLIVPVVGNFAGPKTLRAIGTYLRQYDATVTAFYVSNVEQYLRSGGVWPAFCANVASLPLDEWSVFLRPSGSAVNSTVFGPMKRETAVC
jgi:hypothetical protein